MAIGTRGARGAGLLGYHSAFYLIESRNTRLGFESYVARTAESEFASDLYLFRFKVIAGDIVILRFW